MSFRPELLSADGSQGRRTLIHRSSTRASPVRLKQLRERRAAAFCVNLLRCLETYAEKIAPKNWLQHVLEPANHGNRVEIVEEAQVGDPEKLSLHFALAIGDHTGELLFEALYHRSRIGTLRRVHRRNRRSGSGWR